MTVVALTSFAHARADEDSPFVNPRYFALDLASDDAAPGDALVPPAADGWRTNFVSLIWLIGMDGDVGVGDRTADVSADFGDILDASDSIFAYSGRLEVAKGRWGGFIDGTYAKLGVDDQSGPLGRSEIDITNELAVVDFGLMYRLGQWSPFRAAERNRHDITLDLYAGGRYSHVELEVDPARFESRSRSQDWVDPIVGAKLVLPLSQRWRLVTGGDVGGFSVESDFTWSATAVFGYDFQLFGHRATAFAGYRAIGQDFTDGSGDDEFTWDMILHGPLIGLDFKF